MRLYGVHFVKLKIICCLTYASFLFVFTSHNALAEVYNYCTTTETNKSGYRRDLLEALVSPEHELKVHIITDIPRLRLIRSMELDSIDCDIVITGPKFHDYSTLKRMNVPIMKGLLGTRALIINKENQIFFDTIKTVEDFKQKSIIGSGEWWSDTQILQNNGVTVLPVPDGKFDLMLDGDRYHAYHYSVLDILDNHPQIKSKNHVLEEGILISYKIGNFIYLNPNNPEKIKFMTGKLSDFIKTGQFDSFFYSHRDVLKVFEMLNISSRRTFKLTNPINAYDLNEVDDDLWLKEITLKPIKDGVS